MGNISNEAIWGKLSEIDKKLSNKANENHTAQVSLDSVLEKLEEIRQIQVSPLVQKHHHIIDIQSSWVFLAIVTMSLVILISLFFHFRQREEINRLADNDMKYRYIKAFNTTDTVSIHHLENIFVYRRNNEVISKLKKDVIDFELKAKQRAEELEKARLKELEAEKLKREAERLRK